MIENAQVARDNLILQDRTRWNIDSVSVIRNDDDRALFPVIESCSVSCLISYLETDILAKGDIARNSQMVSLEHVGNGFEAAREFRHLNIKHSRTRHNIYEFHHRQQLSCLRSLEKELNTRGIMAREINMDTMRQNFWAESIKKETQLRRSWFVPWKKFESF